MSPLNFFMTDPVRHTDTLVSWRRILTEFNRQTPNSNDVNTLDMLALILAEALDRDILSIFSGEMKRSKKMTSADEILKFFALDNMALVCKTLDLINYLPQSTVIIVLTVLSKLADVIISTNITLLPSFMKHFESRSFTKFVTPQRLRQSSSAGPEQLSMNRVLVDLGVAASYLPKRISLTGTAIQAAVKEEILADTLARLASICKRTHSGTFSDPSLTLIISEALRHEEPTDGLVKSFVQIIQGHIVSRRKVFLAEMIQKFPANRRYSSAYIPVWTSIFMRLPEVYKLWLEYPACWPIEYSNSPESAINFAYLISLSKLIIGRATASKSTHMFKSMDSSEEIFGFRLSDQDIGNLNEAKKTVVFEQPPKISVDRNGDHIEKILVKMKLVALTLKPVRDNLTRCLKNAETLNLVNVTVILLIYYKVLRRQCWILDNIKHGANNIRVDLLKAETWMRSPINKQLQMAVHNVLCDNIKTSDEEAVDMRITNNCSSGGALELLKILRNIPLVKVEKFESPEITLKILLLRTLKQICRILKKPEFAAQLEIALPFTLNFMTSGERVSVLWEYFDFR